MIFYVFLLEKFWKEDKKRIFETVKKLHFTFFYYNIILT